MHRNKKCNEYTKIDGQIIKYVDKMTMPIRIHLN